MEHEMNVVKNEFHDADDHDDDRIEHMNGTTTATTTTTIIEVQPYEMCTYEECQLRVRTNEISIYECSSKKEQSSPSSYDPCKVITKYRRSVATSTTPNMIDVPKIRSISALHTTIQYLIHHIYLQGQHYTLDNTTNNNRNKTNLMVNKEYIHRINFIDDRIRAVQVDIVKQSNTDPTILLTTDNHVTTTLQEQQQKKILLYIQYNITKYYIYTLYIVSDSIDPKLYECTFAQQALQTSIHSYWNVYISMSVIQQQQVQVQEENDDEEEKGLTQQQQHLVSMISDEMLAYTIAIQLNQQLVLHSQQEQQQHQQLCWSIFWYNYTELYRKISTNTQQQQYENQKLFHGPFTSHAMKVIHFCIQGHWYMALRTIYPSTIEKDSIYTTYDWDRFNILFKCCLCTSIQYIRYQIVSTMNYSIMKNEVISLMEMSRILCYDVNNNNNINSNVDSIQECYDFCQSLQLSISDTTTTTTNMKENNNACDDELTIQQQQQQFQKFVDCKITFQKNPLPYYCSTNMLLRTRSLDRSIFGITTNTIRGIPTTITPITPKKNNNNNSTGNSNSTIMHLTLPPVEWYYQNKVFFFLY